MRISRNIANGPKSNNYFLVGIWVIVCIQKPSNPAVPNLGYMYPQGYICLSEVVHLRLAIGDKNIFTYYLFPNIYPCFS